MRRALGFCGFSLAGLLLLGLLLWQGEQLRAERIASHFPAERRLVHTLGLTDLALWSEARYSRHPSQADRFAPFQDFPAALDHFPAGSIVGPNLPQGTTRLWFAKKQAPR